MGSPLLQVKAPTSILATVNLARSAATTYQCTKATQQFSAFSASNDPVRELNAITSGNGRTEHPIAALKKELQHIWEDRNCLNRPLIRMSQYERDAFLDVEDFDLIPWYNHPYYRAQFHWEKVDEGVPTRSSWIRLPTKTDQMPFTQKMVEAILDARTAEKGIPREDLTVVVAFHGGNPMEVLLWLEKGVQVIAADTSTFSNWRLKRRLKKHGYKKLPQNLKIMNPFWRRNPRGDIVTASHPHISMWRPFRAPKKRITAYAKSDTIFVIQADFVYSFIEPFIKDKAFNTLLDAYTGDSHYFFPSWFCGRYANTKLAIVTPVRD